MTMSPSSDTPSITRPQDTGSLPMRREAIRRIFLLRRQVSSFQLGCGPVFCGKGDRFRPPGGDENPLQKR